MSLSDPMLPPRTHVFHIDEKRVVFSTDSLKMRYYFTISSINNGGMRYAFTLDNTNSRKEFVLFLRDQFGIHINYNFYSENNMFNAIKAKIIQQLGEQVIVSSENVFDKDHTYTVIADKANSNGIAWKRIWHSTQDEAADQATKLLAKTGDPEMKLIVVKAVEVINLKIETPVVRTAVA